MCCGHFLGRDEDIFEYVERCSDFSDLAYPGGEGPGRPPVRPKAGKSKQGDAVGFAGSSASAKANAGGAKEKEKEKVFDKGDGYRDPDDVFPSIVTTFGTHYTCTVGRKRSQAGFYVNDSGDIAELLANLTNSLGDGKGRVELLQFDTESSLGSLSNRSLADMARQNSTQSISRHESIAELSTHRLGRTQSVSNVSNVSDASSI